MAKYQGFGHFILSGLRRLLYLWIKTQPLPQDLSELNLDPSKPVVYVLNRRFLTNALVLSQETENLGLPPAWTALALSEGRPGPSFFFLSGAAPWWRRKADANTPFLSPLLSRLVKDARQNPEFAPQLVPVTILWGRAPDDQNSILKLLFWDGWDTRSAFRQLLTVLLHGRQTIVRFNAPFSLRELVDEGLSEEITLRKLTRVLRVHFQRQREMAIGPDLSHRRTEIDALLSAPNVQAAIAAVDETNRLDPKKAGKGEATAHKYAMEIASDYSYSMILIFARFMSWVWTRLYDGIKVHNFDTVTHIAPDHEIIYVPCHRSHIDYLLMSYLVFQQGLMVPHVAAGANLNFPVVGTILRRSGAFFLRRSFKGDLIYAAVFNEYLHMLIAKGNSIEYFVEGGRSRSGRLLAPMGGMLAMTVQSFLRSTAKPIVFLPVYIGYEKLFEGRSYVSELLGKPKKKESLWDLLLTVRELKKNFGKAHVNFGEPIKLADVLDEVNPEWRSEKVSDAERPAWVNAGIDQLRSRIADNINAAAVTNSVNLTSLALLATPRQAMDEKQLARQLNGYRQLAQAAPYAPRVKITEQDGAGMIGYCEKLKLIQRQTHPLGDILYFSADEAVLATYARNNILHLFALPALLACLFARNSVLSREQLTLVVLSVYPFMRAELFLRWTDEALDGALETSLTALADLGWLLRLHGDEGGGREAVYAAPALNSDEYEQLALLGQTLRPSLMRYFITVAILIQQGSGKVTAAELESLCHLQAQRLSLLHEFNAPEFFDKAIFRTLIATLTKRGQARMDEAGKIHFDENLKEAAAQAPFVLPPDVRQTILSMAR